MPSKTAAPGVMLLIADDWSPLARCYGDPVVQTPHIDRLAQQAAVFDQAFCTTPSCAASRANILTGMYSHQHGQYGHSHGIHGFRTFETLADQTLPATLGRKGCFTGIVGKSHVLPERVYPFDQWRPGSPWSVESMRHETRGFFEDVGERPFYLHVGSLYPHRTLDGGFDRDIAADEMREHDVDYDPQDVVVPAWLPDEPSVRRDLADYYRFVSRYDRFVGAMLEELERAGRRENTMVIVMSDHGMPFPGAKASFYDSGHRCPLIIDRPGHDAARCDASVNWCDIYPTVCEHLGLDESMRPDDLPGRSLLPLIAGASADGWDRTYFSHTFHGVTNYYPYRVVRERRLKFVWHIASSLPMSIPSDLFASPTWRAVEEGNPANLGVRTRDVLLHHAPEELYDLQDDPHETRNVIDRPEYAEDVKRLREDLLAFRRRTEDPFLEVDYQASRVDAW